MFKTLTGCSEFFTSLSDSVEYYFLFFNKNLGIKRFGIFKPVFNAQFLILLLAHIVIWKCVQRSQIVELSDEISQIIELLVIVRKIRNYNVADPHIHILFLEVEREFKYVGIWLFAEIQMMFVLYVLDIQHNEVCNCHETVILFHKLSVVGIEHDTRCIQAGMNIVLFTQLKEFDQEIYLYKGLSACYGQPAAILIEGIIPVILLHYV